MANHQPGKMQVGMDLYEVLMKWEEAVENFNILGLDDIVSTGFLKFLACLVCKDFGGEWTGKLSAQKMEEIASTTKYSQ